MPKILILTNHSYMLYRFRRELIAELQKTHEVVLGMPFVGHESDFRNMGLRCVETAMDRRGIHPGKELGLLGLYCRLLRAERPDLVLTYSIKPNIYGGWACTLAGIPYYSSIQGLGTPFQKPVLSRLASVLYRTALKGAETVFFENQGNASEFLSRRIIPAGKCLVLPGAGVNLKDYCPQPFPEREQVRFVYLGRIMAEKGIRELTTAMARLYARLGQRVVLDVVGCYEEECCREPVEELVRMGAAVFHGFCTEPHPFYAEADCVVLPSYHEGMSNVLLEAAASARPVITSDICGCREAVDDGSSGFLCRPRDADSLYAQMEKMALLPRWERQRMGLAGRWKMERQFDRQQVVSRTRNAICSGRIR